MGNELALPMTAIQPSKYVDEKTFAGMSSAGGFLARLQLFGGNSEAAKEGKIQIGHFGLVSGKDIEDLGKEVQFFALSWRPKALQIDDGEVTSAFNPSTDLFRDIQKKSEEANSGCMYGPEFLVYIPAVDKFATFFMSSKTMRRAAPDLKTILDKGLRDNNIKPATMRSQLIKNKSYSWHGPVITICSQELSLPSGTEMVEVINNFNNPSDTEKETVDETVDERPR